MLPKNLSMCQIQISPFTMRIITRSNCSQEFMTSVKPSTKSDQLPRIKINWLYCFSSRKGKKYAAVRTKNYSLIKTQTFKIYGGFFSMGISCEASQFVMNTSIKFTSVQRKVKKDDCCFGNWIWKRNRDLVRNLRADFTRKLHDYQFSEEEANCLSMLRKCWA